jgi:hypothetical protein
VVRPLRQPADAPARELAPEPTQGPTQGPIQGSSAGPIAPASSAPRDGGPARRLQQELERALVGAPAEPRWSARRSLALIVATNALLWLALLWALRAIF